MFTLVDVSGTVPITWAGFCSFVVVVVIVFLSEPLSDQKALAYAGRPPYDLVYNIDLLETSKVNVSKFSGSELIALILFNDFQLFLWLKTISRKLNFDDCCHFWCGETFAKLKCWLLTEEAEADGHYSTWEITAKLKCWLLTEEDEMGIIRVSSIRDGTRLLTAGFPSLISLRFLWT